MRKMIKAAVALALCVCMVGCGSSVKTETYTSHGTSITMDEGFAEKTLASATVYYEAQTAIVTMLKEEYTILESIGLNEDSTVEEYLDAVLANNQTFEEKQKDGDLLYITYESTVSGNDFFYTATVHKTDDAFWLLNFACLAEDKDEYSSKFIEWAKSVTFE